MLISLKYLSKAIFEHRKDKLWGGYTLKLAKQAEKHHERAPENNFNKGVKTHYCQPFRCRYVAT